MIRHFILFASAICASCNGPSEKEASGGVTSDSNPVKRGDGPFGLATLAGPANLDVDKESYEKGSSLYPLNSVPAPSPDFVQYATTAFDDVGLCDIRAVSETFENDSLGGEAKGFSDRIAEALEAKYGKAKHTDACGGGDVSCQNEFWAMSVMNGERAYGYEWNKLKPPLRSITVWVTADNLSRLSVRLDYELNDAAKCKAAENASRSSNL